MAAEMRNSPGVVKARKDYYKRNITNGHYDFGVQGLLDAGLNPVQQFVGSYNYSISYNQESNMLQFTLTNTTSYSSYALHLWPSSWNWHSGPGSNTNQTFIFTEPYNKSK